MKTKVKKMQIGVRFLFLLEECDSPPPFSVRKTIAFFE